MSIFSGKTTFLLITAVLAIAFLGGSSCRGRADDSPQSPSPELPAAPETGQVLVTNRLDIDFSKHRVTFIELGADRCIPCREMQPIMRDIARQFSGKVQVVFYDVWKDPAPARKYGIQLIPTQVFIDREGREIFRHVGLFPKEEILQMLQEKGIL